MYLPGTAKFVPLDGGLDIGPNRAAAFWKQERHSLRKEMANFPATRYGRQPKDRPLLQGRIALGLTQWRVCSRGLTRT